MGEILSPRLLGRHVIERSHNHVRLGYHRHVLDFRETEIGDAGLIGVVEMVYHLSDTSSSPQMALFGIGFDARSAPPWIAFVAALAAGLGLLRVTARRVDERWGAIQLELQAKAS